MPASRRSSRHDPENRSAVFRIDAKRAYPGIGDGVDAVRRDRLIDDEQIAARRDTLN